MIQYEYKKDYLHNYDINEEYLDKLGNEGWEIIHVYENTILHKSTLLCKRRKELK